MMYPIQKAFTTLWPASPNEKVSIEFAIEALGNRLLKLLVARLSEIITA
jgi:hypothetical protein